MIGNVPRNSRKISSLGLGLVAALVLGLVPEASFARSRRDGRMSRRMLIAERKKPRVKFKRSITRQQAISNAKRKQSGKVLSVKEPRGDKSYYEVKIISNGRVKVIRVNSKTGKPE